LILTRMLKDLEMNGIIYPKYRWFILFSLCVVQATAVMALVCPATMIGEISKTMDIDMGAATQITMVVVQIFIGVSALVGGGIVDRFGAYRVWAGCSIFFVIGTLLVPVIGNTVWGMLFIRLIHGFGAGPVMATAPLVAAQSFPIKERGFIIGMQGAAVSVGAMISLTFVPFVFQKTGSWQTALAWMTIFFVLTLILSIIVSLGPKPPTSKAKPHHDLPQLSKSDIKKAYRLAATWAAILCSLWFSWVVGVFRDVLTNYLSVNQPEGVGLGPLKAGGAMSSVMVVFFASSIASGVILEKAFKGRVKIPVMLGFLLTTILWFSIKFPAVYSHMGILTGCMLVGGFGIALTSPLLMTFFAKNYPECIMGKLGGLIVVFNIIGGLIGEGVSSLAISMTGRYDAALILLASASFMGFLGAMLLKEPKIFP
jgi:predicted MFS family arabinose efflux permease